MSDIEAYLWEMIVYESMLEDHVSEDGESEDITNGIKLVIKKSKNDRVEYKDHVQGHNGKYFLGYNEGHLNQNGGQVDGRIALVKAEGKKPKEEKTQNLKNPELLYEDKNIRRPYNAAVNDKGEAVIDNSTTNSSSELRVLDREGGKVFTEEYDSNIDAVGISDDGKVAVVTLPPLKKVFLYASDGEELWCKENLPEYPHPTHIEFNQNEKRIRFVDKFNGEDFYMDYE